ncbi:ABC transporter substrate-binding protein [Sulfuricurvum sp.]|uniref:ABC transporter substrate-binding protein n=1 Tax=Sulfuricurvum sp. TaxID=2025608 RepID=UPI00260A6B51|nr:ABC transporter substrate-binding protein [Sulfuricurvum sp.]MDD2266760.1 hypothetical protein [Sulfuricurvum sp.]MDD2784583.1 hypothetical protein [Sulfuricurvum sp.]
MQTLCRILITTLLCTISLSASDLSVKILYLDQKVKHPPVLSNVMEKPDNLGLEGAKIAVEDSEKTARFMNQHYALQTEVSGDETVLLKAFEQYVDQGGAYVILNVQYPLFVKLLANPKSQKVLMINAGLSNPRLRMFYCNPNLLHTIADDTMLYDGLMQFLVKRNFKKIFLIEGKTAKDKNIVYAIKRAAKKFGAKIVQEKVWDNNSDIRRKAEDELPVFTQGEDYDVILTADYYGDFGEVVYFNSWLPRPVAGTQGLTPVEWHKSIEQWGAAQMQDRFKKYASRGMESEDFAAWVAVRTIVTSIMHTNTSDLKTNLAYIRSNEFELAAYMGRKLSYRSYNGQLRMPISLVQPNALISTSPQVGFLDPVTDLDTLGIAASEMKCKRK